jgi:heme/copper-type cytochrome/quinol oxidase subunit 2
MVLRQQAFVYIYYSNTAMLVLVWIVTGVILWFGLKGKMSENKTNEEEDFHF